MAFERMRDAKMNNKPCEQFKRNQKILLRNIPPSTEAVINQTLFFSCGNALILKQHRILVTVVCLCALDLDLE